MLLILITGQVYFVLCLFKHTELFNSIKKLYSEHTTLCFYLYLADYTI